MFSLKCYEGYISHKNLERSDPIGQMLEGGEEHNISKTQPDPTVQYRDIDIWVSALNVLSLSLIRLS